MEAEWFVIMDRWQSYASPTVSTFLTLIPSPILKPVLEKVFSGIRQFSFLSVIQFSLSTSSAIIEDLKNMRGATSTLIAYYYFDFRSVASTDC